MSVSGDPTRSNDEALCRLYAYWCECRGTRAFPSRREIDPVDFAYALGRVSLIELEPNSQRFRYRLAATTVADHLGYEMSRRYVDEIPEPEVRAYVMELYERTFTTGEVQHEIGERVLDERVWRHETLVLPLGESDDAVDMILVYRRTERPRSRRPNAKSQG
jgi:hypothetical protein